MMGLFFMYMFMTPLIFMSNFMLIQYTYIVMYLYMMMSFGFNNYFSMISYFMGVDKYSYSLMLLTLIIGSLMLISMMNCHSITMFLFMNLMLTLFLTIIFTSMNFMYMYISFEFVLVPLVIIILGWGYQPERLLAGMYLFFYTVLVSLPLFVLIICMYNNINSVFFDYLFINSNFLLEHLVIMLVFMVKLPMYLLHFWLPKAHVQAPVPGSMILAALMLKIGGYGIIRVMCLYEYMFVSYSYIWFCFGLLGSVVISMICLVQSDIKCLIAYSSISHMGMVIVGLMTMSMWGLLGAYFLMLGHGFCSSGLFYISNLLYIRTNSRSFYINKGLINYMPSLSLFFFMICAFNMSCPPSFNFVSELMIIPSMVNFWEKSVFLFIGLSFFCACFSYYLYSFSQHGVFHNLYSFSMITTNEFLCVFIHLIPLVLIVFIINSLI